MKTFFLNPGFISCVTLSFAQSAESVSAAQVQRESADRDVRTEWRQDPGAAQSGAGAGSSTSSKTAAENPWELDFHFGAAFNPHSTGGTGFFSTSTTNPHPPPCLL